LQQLERARLLTAGLRSKAWDEFSRPGAPELHFVFTVCDNAAKEVCPIWPGQSMTAHWGVPEPAAVRGTAEQIERAFRDAFFTVDRRIGLFPSLPLASVATALLANTLATGAMLTTLILTLGPVSGAHFQSRSHTGDGLGRQLAVA
jgi:arsenate reductase (thioredoxin)